MQNSSRTIKQRLLAHRLNKSYKHIIDGVLKLNIYMAMNTLEKPYPTHTLTSLSKAEMNACQ